MVLLSAKACKNGRYDFNERECRPIQWCVPTRIAGSQHLSYLAPLASFDQPGRIAADIVALAEDRQVARRCIRRACQVEWCRGVGRNAVPGGTRRANSSSAAAGRPRRASRLR